jgi:actin-related protein 5
MITEAPFIPGYSRAQLIQLAFECYGASKLCFGIDALFSLLYDHHNNYAGCRVTNTFSQPEDGGPQNADLLFDFVVPPSGLEHREGSSSMSDLISYPLDALVVSSGFETTHVLPVVDGNLDNHGVVRINVGGHHATELLNKSIHMHYPQHKASWAKLQASFPGSGPGYGAAESLKEQECFLATPDYLPFLRDIQHGNVDNTFVRYLQFSYEPSPIVTITEDERREREARRLENAERLREMSKRKKEEKLIDKANRLDVLEELFDARVKLSNQDFHAKLIEAQIDEEDWMNAALGGPRDCVVQEISEIRKYLERSVDDAILAERQAPAWKGWTLEQKLESQIAKFPLTVVPDNDLSEEELRIKKAHLKVRAMCDTKIRRSHERDLEKARKASTAEGASSAPAQTSNSKQVKMAEEIDLEDDGGVTTKEVVEIHLDESKDLMVFGLDELQSQRKAIWNRLQRRQAALRERKSELKNASDAANKATVSDLVNFAPASGGVGMSGPGVGTTSINGIGSIANAIGARSSRAKKSAMLMYSAAADVRLDLDEAGLERMALHRADNTDMASVVATQRVGELTSLVEAQNASVNADKSLLAKVDDEILSRLDPQILRQREAESYQLSMGIDRIRCPEILFQPSIVGIEQQGITEVIHSVLTRLGAAESALSSTRLPTALSIDRRASLLQNVYLTGGNCSFPRMTQRLFTGLAADLPVGSSLRVIQSSSPSLNAWRGAALFSNDPLNRQHHFIDQEAYLEEGADRLHARFMSHFASNRP